MRSRATRGVYQRLMVDLLQETRAPVAIPAMLALVAAMGALLAHGAAPEAPPTLYRQPAYESPVEGEPDDLLMIAGFGFEADDTVVYRQVGSTALPLTPPAALPAAATAAAGIAPVVSTDDLPYSLTVRLPTALLADETYALWVHTPSGQWSQPIMINDARPTWLSPVYVYTTERIAGLPRYIKVIGRNLQAAPRQVTRLELTGPQNLVLSAEPAGNRLDHYVGRFSLPARLLPGRYAVSISRDGRSWVPLLGQPLEVRSNPAPRAQFRVDDPRFGGCKADDDRDDTRCIVRAIEAARAAGGGTVVLGAGTWDLIDSGPPGVRDADGIGIPEGVHLQGEGAAVTRLVRHAEWDLPYPKPAFFLLGGNIVEGFTFEDLKRYAPTDPVAPFLQIGRNFQGLATSSPELSAITSDIVITSNVFDRTAIAIGDGGLGMARLFITHNEFGAYRRALDLSGDRYNNTTRFRIDDAVIAFNSFKPGSFLSLPTSQGTMASELGASSRMDFSDNVADGTATNYLYSADDAHGWRAAFFWHLAGDQEQLLVSDNTASCTGDKDGDGEAIGFDNNVNTFAFDSPRQVISASSDSVTVAGPMSAEQNGHDVAVRDYYVGHWLQVGSGPGIGQTRKIVGYEIDDTTGRVTFRIAPGWDVVPHAGETRISVGREFWQAYVVANRIEHRRPPCLKTNRTRSAGGAISIWAQSAESVVDGNVQYGTDGITYNQSYRPPEHPCAGCSAETFFQSFLQIRNNLVDGTYDPASDCNASGILASMSAAPWGSTSPPTLGYGVLIAHNRLVHADNTTGGAIALEQTWYAGPAPHLWPLATATLIDHNDVVDVDSPLPTRRCNSGHPRIGIGFPAAAITHATVLYANSCARVPLPLKTGGGDSTRVCPTTGAASCECP